MSVETDGKVLLFRMRPEELKRLIDVNDVIRMNFYSYSFKHRRVLNTEDEDT